MKIIWRREGRRNIQMSCRNLIRNSCIRGKNLLAVCPLILALYFTNVDYSTTYVCALQNNMAMKILATQ